MQIGLLIVCKFVTSPESHPLNDSHITISRTIKNSPWAGDVAQLIERLSSMCKALGWMASITKKQWSLIPTMLLQPSLFGLLSNPPDVPQSPQTQSIPK
jgi:hypothetical protein